MGQKDYALRHRALGLCRNCPRKLATNSAIYCEYHRDKDKIYKRKSEKIRTQLTKKACIEAYGGKCSCCGESLLPFLTIDHCEGGGNNHRKELFKHNVGGLHMYRWLKRNNYPAGYAVLCMNCNWAKRYGGVCPHKLKENK